MEMFDPPLGPDPSVALKPPPVSALVEGPAHRVQFVVELIGPRSIPAATAAQLLSDQWYGALGQPELFCMAPKDASWQPLTGRKDGSYDSLVACWDIVSVNGLINRRSAEHLFKQMEHFGQAIGRRAAPLPVPADIDRIGKELMRIHEQLDIGVSIVVYPRSGQVAERDLWIVCSRLGLQFSPSGSFDWRVPGFPYPLLMVTPIGTTESFSLGAVQDGATHDGVTVGFNFPRSPNPLASLDGALAASNEIARQIRGLISDEEGRELTSSLAEEMRNASQMAVEAFEQLGIRPGSRAALKLF